MISFVVEQESFSGPLGLLLELLDKKELEIKDVNLAAIADDYLKRMDATEVSSEEMADFLLVASRLIYLKSKELMPYLRIDSEEEGIASLEDQLRLYRMFVNAAEKIENLFAQERQMFPRPFRKKKVVAQAPVFQPATTSVKSLSEAFKSVMKRLEPFFALQETSIERIKSVEERIGEMQNVLTSGRKIHFADVMSGAKSKAEVVVSFLALLELVRRNVVRASQQKGNEIEIHLV